MAEFFVSFGCGYGKMAYLYGVEEKTNTLTLSHSKRKGMENKVGSNAGLVWQALNGDGAAVEVKDLKKQTKLTDKEIYAAFGWLLREGKISLEEKGKEVYASLI